MPKYIVLSPIKMPEGIVREGEVSLSEEDAAPLISLGVLGDQVVEESADPTDPAERLAAIREAIGNLDKGTESNWISGGRPDIAALSQLLGWKVAAKERDAAWAAFQESGE